jgi:hypothetical protein
MSSIVSDDTWFGQDCYVNRPDFGGDSILWRKMESWQSAAAVPTPPNGGIRRS